MFQMPVHSLTDLIKYAKANPGKLSFASGGSGSPHHLLAELLRAWRASESQLTSRTRAAHLL